MNREPTEDEVTLFIKDVTEVCDKHGLQLTGYDMNRGFVGEIAIVRNCNRRLQDFYFKPNKAVSNWFVRLIGFRDE